MIAGKYCVSRPDDSGDHRFLFEKFHEVGEGTVAKDPGKLGMVHRNDTGTVDTDVIDQPPPGPPDDRKPDLGIDLSARRGHHDLRFRIIALFREIRYLGNRIIAQLIGQIIAEDLHKQSRELPAIGTRGLLTPLA